MTFPFEVAVQEAPGGGPMLKLRGELDLSVEPLLLQVAEGLRSDGHESIRVDLSELTFIDSRGLAALVRMARDGTSMDRRAESSADGIRPYAGPST